MSRIFPVFISLFTAAAPVLIVFGLVGCASGQGELDTQNDFDAHEKIGMGFLSAHNFPSAMTEFKTAAKIKPNDPAVHNNLALVYFFRDHPAEAERELRRALQINPHFTDARNNLGRLYIELAQYQDALRELSRCEQDLTYSAPEKIQYNLALVNYKLGRYEEAKAHAQRAVARDPKMCESLQLIGESDFQSGHYKDAETDLNKAQENCDVASQQEVHFYLGLSYFHSGDVLKAKNILEELVRGEPGSAYSKRAQSALRIIR